MTRRSSGERWSNADLLFLASALDRGMSLAETAGFLGRTEDRGTEAERTDRSRAEIVQTVGWGVEEIA